MKLIAPAKINLMLRFTGRRKDGYHLMQSAVAFADIGDEIEVWREPVFSVEIHGVFKKGVPANRSNLVVQAAEMMVEYASKSEGCKIILTKNIPTGAGLGGGSSDAACVMRALYERWDKPFPEEELYRLATRLGADVLVCLQHSAQWMEGIGDVVSPVAMDPMHAVLIWPGQGLATPEMYDAYRTSKKPFSDVIEMPAQIDAAFLRDQHNDFTDAAIECLPALADILDDLRAQDGAILSRLSGSGSACFGLYETQAAAKKAADVLSAAYSEAWVRPCVLA